MREVEAGSSAEAGSSISKTSGFVASARAMHSRCCCPPESAIAESRSRSLASFHRAARCSDCSTISVNRALSVSPAMRGPNATLSKIDLGNGVDFWKTMPIRFRSDTTSTSFA